jgi:hypothetical protein
VSPADLGPPVLGLDVGGVVVDRAGDDDDTSFFGDRPMESPSVPDAFEAIASLAAGPFGGRVHIVSKAGPRVARLTREWLEHTGFYERTGLDATCLHFVRRRPDKAAVCVGLGITHFVDDQLGVLEHLGAVRRRYLLLAGLGSHPRPSSIPGWVTVAERWPELAGAIEDDVAAYTEAARRPGPV